MRTIRRIIIHHAGANADAATIDEWHRARGFSGIGYHYVVTPDGRIEQGRPEAVVGAHAKGANSDSLGVCLGIDAREGIPDVVMTTTRYLVANLVWRLGLTPSDVYGHREVGTTPTVCPGVDPAVFREAVAATLAEPRAWAPGAEPPDYLPTRPPSTS